jgi:DNA-binding NarL/FixJ family response regulator
MAATRVVVIDDDVDVQELLALLFDLDDRFELVGVANTGLAGVELVRRLVPDAVVVDLELPGIDGLAVVDQVRALELDIRIIVFSAFPDPFTLLDVLRRGAHGYLNKATAWSELLPMLAGLFHDTAQSA